MMRIGKTALALITAGSLLVVPSQHAAGAGVGSHRAAQGPALNDVVAIAADDAWAVGDGGIARHWDGAAWTSRHLGGLRSPILAGVDATSASDVWAVGGVIVFDAFRAFVSHWDGTAWHRVVVPGSPGEVIVEDVVARSAADAWIVGRWFGSTPAGTRSGAVILHWNGAAWRRTGAPAGVTLTAAAVLGGGDLLAVGRTTHTGAPVAVRGTAGSWRVIPLPTETGAHCVVHDVTALPLVAVGTCREGMRPDRRAHPYIVERRSGLWTLEPVTGSASLWGVGGGAATWAVGRSSTTGQPLTLRRRPDASWFRVAAPSVPLGGLLRAVDVRTFNDAWSVGWRRQGAANRPLALHWDGASWATVPVPVS
jgi:hypothetical protein